LTALVGILMYQRTVKIPHLWFLLTSHIFWS